MRVDLLSEKELQAVKKVSEYCDFYEDCNFDVEHALDIDWVTINKGRNGRLYAWLLDETNNVICDVETLEITEDEDFIDEQFC